MRLRLGLVAPFPNKKAVGLPCELRVAICLRDLYGLGDEDGACSKQF